MKNAFYFQHDNNARNDDRILMLRAKFGSHEGYSLFFWFLESMASTEDGYLIREAIGGLSIAYGVDIDRLHDFVTYCIEIGLFKENGNTFYSERMTKQMLFRMALSDGGKKGAKAKWLGHKKANGPPNGPPNAKERKGKERKEEERKETLPSPNGVVVPASIQETDIQRIVKGWKVLNGIPIEGPDSASWDKVHFPRHAKSANALLTLFGSRVEALDCMEHVFGEMQRKKLSATIETIVKHSDLYRETLRK